MPDHLVGEDVEIMAHEDLVVIRHAGTEIIRHVVVGPGEVTFGSHASAARRTFGLPGPCPALLAMGEGLRPLVHARSSPGLRPRQLETTQGAVIAFSCVGARVGSGDRAVAAEVGQPLV